MVRIARRPFLRLAAARMSLRTSDNERLARHIVGLTQTDTVRRFDGSTQTVGNGDYLYLYMDCGDGEYCISAGIVIASPFPTRPYKWCCVLDEDIRYWQDD